LRFLQSRVGCVTQVDRDQERRRFGSRRCEHRSHYGISAKPWIAGRRRLLGQRRDLSRHPRDLEGDFHGSCLGVRNILAGTDRFHVSEVGERVLLYQLLGTKAQAFRASIHLGRLRPLLD
jgi:hypothetical protein